MIAEEQKLEQKEVLKQLREHKDWQSLDEIPRDIFFPEYIFECESVAIFFASMTQGKNDVIHFYDHGFKNVLINDVKKMDLMEVLYPKEWTYITKDAVRTVKDLNEQNKKFDVVTCDTGMKMLYDNFKEFYQLANKYFCMYVNDLGLESFGIKADTKELSEYFNCNVKEVFKRPDSVQTYNKYWVIFEKEMLK